MKATETIPSESFYVAVGTLAHEGGYRMTEDEALQRAQRGVTRLGHTWEQIVSPVRLRPLVDARKMVSYFLRDQGWTYKAIGQVMNRDHATAVHHVRSLFWLIETEDHMSRKYNEFLSA
jgi:hypothetical protein